MSEYTIEGAMKLATSYAIALAGDGIALPHHKESLRDYITKLVEQDRKDAQRYRWLRDKARSVEWSRNIDQRCHMYQCRTSRDQMDADIDAAIAASGEGEKK